MRLRLPTILGGMLVALALVGLLPLMPRVLGFVSGTVVNASGGNFTPTTQDTPFISCTFVPTAGYDYVRLDDNNGTTYNNIRIFRCTNNFPFDVNVTWSLANANGMKLINVTGSTTIPAGAQNACTGGLSLDTKGGGAAKPVAFQGAVDQPSLYAVFQFAVPVGIANNSVPTQC